ncbi:neutral zinc metallopeptidase [Allgaiera indica]|uniref:Neutral zinc metallopeptidase n=1 Tax=Allgaiera indica TaxID=765699 RepID=A0AAN4UNV0_9RHOB|nr:metallopeptidase family protein [Allgaiera indica]GHD98747.1 neutral zinc metallopeptidase [Allgaiera indica]SDW07107.1 Predicted Zn-dependent protease, minimal metalloprotease (MMP)-like domain [Allgaiera indica]
MTNPQTGWEDIAAPDAEVIEALARASLAALPETYRTAAQRLALRVVDLAPDTMLDELGIDDPYTLTGLYDGIPLTEASVADQPQRPQAIWLFRRAILDEWVARGDVTLADLVTNVMVHELAHHFGWSDAQIAQIDRWWE